MNGEEKYRLMKFLKETGQEEKYEEIVNGKRKEVKLKRYTVKAIEDALTRGEIVTLSPTRKGRFQFVNQKYVTISRRYTYENPEIQKAAIEKSRRKRQEKRTAAIPSQGIFETAGEAGGGVKIT